jgi:thiosulfate dehydrogenase
MIKQKKLLAFISLFIGFLVFFSALLLKEIGIPPTAEAHKEPHTPQQLKAFQDQFMAMVIEGDKLFHGGGSVKLSKTGMACAMCHPYAADTHPHEFPKYQEQMGKFATLRDMINWCIEKPNEGEKIDPESDAMKALEAYIYWSNKGSVLDPGRH